MNLKKDLKHSLDKIKELEAQFKDASPSISVLASDSSSLVGRITQLHDALSGNLPEAIRKAVDAAWVANARELSATSSRDVEINQDKDNVELQKIDLLSKFYFKKTGLSEDEMSQLITYSNRIAKANELMAQATGLRIKMINEVSGILGNLAEFSQKDAENGICTIQINHDKLFDISKENKDLLKELEVLISNEHDSRSSSITSLDDKENSASLIKLRAKLSSSGLLQRFESIMNFNKMAKEHTILNNLWSLENIIKQNPSIYDLETQQTSNKQEASGEKMFGLDMSGELIYLGNCEDFHEAEERAINLKKEIVFFIDEGSANDWREILPDLKQDCSCVGISDSLMLYNLGNPSTMHDADVSFQEQLDSQPSDSYAWISDLDGQQAKQWIKVLETSLYNKPQKKITATVGIGSGDYYQDGAFGAIEEENIEATELASIVDKMQEFVFYNDVDDSTYLDGEIMVDDVYLTTIDWKLLKFKENFKAERQNRVSNTGDDAKAMDFLSHAFTTNTLEKNDMKVAKSIYTACYKDANCLEKLSTVFSHGAKGIDVNEKIAFDLTALAAYFGDVTASHNVTKQLKRGRVVSDELTQLLTTLGDIDGFNSWIGDRSNIETKAVEKTAAKHTPISDLMK